MSHLRGLERDATALQGEGGCSRRAAFPDKEGTKSGTGKAPPMAAVPESGAGRPPPVGPGAPRSVTGRDGSRAGGSLARRAARGPGRPDAG